MQMGTGPMLWAGYLWALGGAGIVLGNAVQVVRGWKTGVEARYLSMVIMGLYPLGVGCKMALLGPEFMRFYLSDIGFPVFLGYALFSFATRNREEPGTQNAVVFLEDFLGVLRTRRAWLVAAICLSVLFELLMGLLFHLRPDLKELRTVGDFDWWDVVAYCTGGGAGYVMLVVWSRWVRGAIGYQRQVQESVQQQARRRQQPKKKRRKDR